MIFPADLNRFIGTMAPGRMIGGEKIAPARVVTLLCSPEAPAQYIPLMNAIFSAQKHVGLDQCIALLNTRTYSIGRSC